MNSRFESKDMDLEPTPQYREQCRESYKGFVQAAIASWRTLTLATSKVFARLKCRSCSMYRRRVVRSWQVIAEEVSKERNQERFTELLKELFEALEVEQNRKPKVPVVPKVREKVMQFPMKAAPSR